jgi:ABC-type lipoprotein release transport system permease subunit
MADRSSGPWIRVGWRNLGRNRRRTVITAAGLAFGYFAVVLMNGLIAGMTAEMIDNGTGFLMGQLQVHAADYLPQRSIHETIGGRAGTDIEALLQTVAADPAIEATAPRVYAGGLVSSGEATTASMLVGVDPRLEPLVSRIFRGIVRGRPPGPDRREILIGEEMARQLAVAVGDEVVLVAPAADGSLGNDLFTVSGIFRSGMVELDALYAALPIGSLQALTALAPERVHEIAAATSDPWQARAAAGRLGEGVAALAGGATVQPWTELRPEMLDYAQLAKGWSVVVIAIVFAIAIFGVANTMLLATFERRREFAVLMAIGASPLSVLRTILWEALALGAISLVAGTLISVPVLIWWHAAPPDLGWLYGDFTMFGALIRPILRVEYDPSSALWAGGALVLTALLAALYPAARAARLPPADTLAGD